MAIKELKAYISFNPEKFKNKNMSDDDIREYFCILLSQTQRLSERQGYPLEDIGLINDEE